VILHRIEPGTCEEHLGAGRDRQDRRDAGTMDPPPTGSARSPCRSDPVHTRRHAARWERARRPPLDWRANCGGGGEKLPVGAPDGCHRTYDSSTVRPCPPPPLVHVHASRLLYGKWEMGPCRACMQWARCVRPIYCVSKIEPIRPTRCGNTGPRENPLLSGDVCGCGYA
jgi:hypothetical protein